LIVIANSESEPEAGACIVTESARLHSLPPLVAFTGINERPLTLVPGCPTAVVLTVVRKLAGDVRIHRAAACWALRRTALTQLGGEPGFVEADPLLKERRTSSA